MDLNGIWDYQFYDDVLPWDKLKDVIDQMKEKAAETWVFQYVVFNEVPVLVSPNDTRTTENFHRRFMKAFKKVNLN